MTLLRSLILACGLTMATSLVVSALALVREILHERERTEIRRRHE